MKNTITLNFTKTIELEEECPFAYIKYANIFFSIKNGEPLLWPNKYETAEVLENNEQFIIVTKNDKKKLFNTNTATFVKSPIGQTA